MPANSQDAPSGSMPPGTFPGSLDALETHDPSPAAAPQPDPTPTPPQGSAFADTLPMTPSLTPSPALPQAIVPQGGRPPLERQEGFYVSPLDASLPAEPPPRLSLRLFGSETPVTSVSFKQSQPDGAPSQSLPSPRSRQDG